MPLPANGTAWPPAALTDITPRLDTWSAWYSGDPDALRAAYTGTRPAARFDRPAQYRGGVAGAIARWWWGRPVGDLTTGQADQLHVPIAADLCQASADLLYSEPPKLTADTPAVTDHLEGVAEDGLMSTLSAGAEVGAALGGRYHRVSWDRDLHPGGCFLTTVDADVALPEFRYDRLVGVTFWWVVARDGQVVRRHLERHELDTQGRGIVLHGLYEGSEQDLGRVIPLTEDPGTEALADSVDADGAIVEGRTPGLLVEYIPNQRPNRRWRHHPVGRSLGRSDLDGVEPLMDALDETYASWMRDLRLAKSRIFVPEYMTRLNAPGQGATVDLDREVYVPLNMAAPEEGNSPLTLNQFAIRVEEHRATAQELVGVILRSAGYSARTFGEDQGGAAVTATEITSQERRSFLSRDRKVRLERPALAALAAKMVTIDRDVFGVPALPAVPPRVDVQFPDGVQEPPLVLANTAEVLFRAGAASTATLVRIVHPDWDDPRVTEEVAAIEAERAAGTPSLAPDPFTFRGDPTPDDDPAVTLNGGAS